MRIDSKQLLFGRPVLKIREVVRHAMADRLWGNSKDALVNRIAEIIQCPKNAAANVLKQLIAEGYLIVKRVKFPGRIQYGVEATEEGRRFGVASANPAITRSKADQLLKELIERANAINNDGSYAYYVERLQVFGSYLTDKEVLNDLDVFYRLTIRHEGEKGRVKWQERIALAFNNGRRFSNYVEEIYWPEREVLLALKTRKKGLSLHDERADEVFTKTESKTVYEYQLK